MSFDVIAIFDARDCVTPEWLLEKLVAKPTFASEVTERYRDLWQPKAWTIHVSNVTGQPELFGPGGFAIRFEPRTIVLYHAMHFATFTSNEPSRRALRHALLEVADLVGSSRSIITHELMGHEGAGLDAIERHLRVRIGPPADSFDELDAAGLFEPEAWYIDTFADLRESEWP
jgi:hypothetical protein